MSHHGASLAHASRMLVTLLAASLAGVPSLPSEIPERTDFDHRPVFVSSMLGFGTALGLLGVAAGYTPASRVSVGAGVGTNGFGPMFALFSVVRPFAWARTHAHALSIMPAYSVGEWAGNAVDISIHASAEAPYSYHSELAHWFQADIGYELLTRGGFWFRPAVGVAVMLNPGDAVCTYHRNGAPCAGHGTLKGELPGDVIPTLGASLGYAFGAHRR